MKKFISSVLVAAAATLVLPFTFTSAVNGCSDPSYTYGTMEGTESQVRSAANAKQQFCGVLETARRLYR
jgi:hypothetical protein